VRVVVCAISVAVEEFAGEIPLLNECKCEIDLYAGSSIVETGFVDLYVLVDEVSLVVDHLSERLNVVGKCVEAAFATVAFDSSVV
jgi:hypothetical protein